MNEMNFKNRGEQVFETLKREILDLKLEPGRMISEMRSVSASGSPGPRCGMLCGCSRNRDL